MQTLYNSNKKFFHNLVFLFSLIALNAFSEKTFAQCSNVSSANCNDVIVTLPYQVNFNGNEGVLLDKDGVKKTGFTMVQSHSATRDVADRVGTVAPYQTYPSIPGYEPSKLTVTNDGYLDILSTKGNAQVGTNNQVNTLGVGFLNSFQDFDIETALINPTPGPLSGGATGVCDVGLWYGYDQNNYIKLVMTANNRIEFRREIAGVSVATNNSNPATSERIILQNINNLTTNKVTFRMQVINTDGDSTKIKAFYRIGNAAEIQVGGANFELRIVKPNNLANGITLGTQNNVVFAGIYTRYGDGGTVTINPYTARFDYFKVEPKENLIFNPTSANLAVGFGGSAQNISANLSTTVGTPSNITLTDITNSPWLTLPSLVGIGNLDFTVNPTGLAIGVYNATVVANANGFKNDTLTIQLQVGESSLTFSPKVLNFSVQQGGTTTDQVATLSTPSGNPTITLEPNINGNWVVLPSNPQLGTLNFNVNANGLAAGNYTTTVIAKAQNHKSDTLIVNLQVNPIEPNISTWLHKINFQNTAYSGVPANYIRDIGESYALRTGANQGTGLNYGWINASTGLPYSITDLAFYRTGLASVAVELKSGNQMQVANREAKWEFAVPSQGFYWVKLSAGDWPNNGTGTSNTDNYHVLNVEGQNVLNFNQTPTATGGNAQATALVQVIDGKLTIDATGGTKTRINYIWITPANPADDNIPPVVSLNFSGIEDSPKTFRNQVTVSINGSDAGGSGLKSVKYSLNGAAFQNYTTPIVINTIGDYTLSVQADDNNNNIVTTPAQTFKVIQYNANNTKLFVRNETKFPDNDNYSFSFIQGDGSPVLQGPNYAYPNNFNYNHDSNVMRIFNYGIAPLVINDLDLSDDVNFKIAIVDGIQIGTGNGQVPLSSVMPLVVAPGSYKDITLIFTARNLNATLPQFARKMFHETLTITSNDDAKPIKTVNLHGIYQQLLEGDNEPDAQEMIEVNGLKTQTGFVQNNPNHASPIADEIFSSYFVRVDASKPVYMRQMSAYHGCCGSTEAIRWQPKSNANQQNTIMTHFSKDGQTILPRLNNGGIGEATFIPTEAFSIKIAGDNTDPNRNNYQATDANGNKYRGVRVWKAINWEGEIIPNAYIMAHDYLGGGSNFDYNDNMYYFENIKPEIGTAYFSELASGTGVSGQANEKQSNLEFNNTPINTATALTLHLRSKGQTYANGTADPDIIVSKVEIIGTNLTEFIATNPTDLVLSPQEATTLQVNFNPTTAGTKSATLLIHYNSADSPLRIPLFGLATSDCFNLTLTNRIKVGATSSANLVLKSKTWTPDLAFRGANTAVQNGADNTTEILQTDSDALYRSYLSTTANGQPLALNIPIANNGKYLVRLHFAEMQWEEAGRRVNNILLEGKLQTIGLDIYNEIGYRTAYTKDYQVSVGDNVLNLLINPTTHRPAISGIELYSLTSTSPMTVVATITGTNCGSSNGAINATVNNAQNGLTILYKLGENGTYQANGQFNNLAAGTYTIFAKEDVANGCEVEGVFVVNELNNNIAFDITTTPISCGETNDGTATVSNIIGGTAPYTIAWNTYPIQTSATATGLTVGNFTTVTITDAIGCSKTQTVNITNTTTCPIRINAAGPAFIASGNREFIADQYFNGGNVANANREIGNTTDDVLYQSERWINGTLTYSVPVVNGNYQVVLHFAEIFFTNANQRKFHVNIEGTRVLTDFDIFATAGARDIAVTRTFNTTVADGTMTIEFLKGSVDNAKVSAIEIIYVGANGNNPPTVATPITAQNAYIDLPLNLTVSEYTFVDADAGNNLTLSATLVGGGALPAWLTFNPTTKTFSGTPLEANLGTLQIALKATDNAGAFAVNEFDLVVSRLAGSNVSFLKSIVTGVSIEAPSSLQFGPDGRLYVSQVNGLIKAFTLQRTEPGKYAVTATETIDLVQKILNYNDDGTPNPNVNTRQVLGLLVKGTAASPILYVSSNDPRTGGGNGDLNLDTNSGTISKVFKNGSNQWEKIDLIRGLPKSEHNHATNGLQIDETNNKLFIAQGGHANKGAPSHELAWLPEYAYSAAILEANLTTIEALPTQGTGNNKYKYDLPTITGVGPFGGNNGFNQAVLVQGGPVQIYAPGFRNAYDIVLTEQGKLYTWDNSSNANWGVPPIARKADSLATNITERDFNNNVNNIQDTHYKINDNNTYYDPFHYISHKGYYGGNANPTRANPAINRFNGIPAVPNGFDFGFPHGTNTKDGLENKFLTSGRPGTPKQNQSLFGVMGSTNGLCEYRASNFNGRMKGNILGASFNGILYRVALTANGTALDNTIAHNGSNINGVIHLAEGFGTWNILDVASQGDTDIFPGTVWIAEFTRNVITVLEPNDFNQCNFSNPADNPTADFDADGYTNLDEIQNGTDPCSSASSPEDWDGDKISDLNDTDDDNDGILDINDAFAIDKNNGTTTNIPVKHEWEATGGENAGYILNSGFSGMMINNASNYKNLYEIDNLTVIGTGGLFTIDSTTNGTARLTANNQAYGFQMGVNVGAYPGNYMFHTAVASPFEAVLFSDLADQNMGLHIGKGDQKNFLKIVTDANNGAGGIRVYYELNDVVQNNILHEIAIMGQQDVNLYLIVDKATNQVQPAYSIDNEPITYLGTPISVPANWLSGVVATGVIASAETGARLGATWEFFRVIPVPSTSQATVTINSGNILESASSDNGSFKIINNSPNGQKITKVVIDLSTSVFPDMVFDPANVIQDLATAKPFTVNSGGTETGHTTFTYTNPHNGNVANGYNSLEINFTDFDQNEVFEFSIDTDPTSIKGTTIAHEAGKVSGLELIGANVNVSFNDGSGHSAKLYRLNNEVGASSNIFKQEAPNAPSIAAIGFPTSKGETTTVGQTIQITGKANTEVKLLILEGGLFVNNVPAGGFDIDAYEANKLVKVVDEKTVTIPTNGSIDVPIDLFRTEVANTETGLNYIVAVVKDAEGRTSTLSNTIVIHLKSGPPVASYRINAGGGAYTAVSGAEFSADAYFSAGNVDNPANLQIANTEDDAMYSNNRWNNTMAYNFPVSNGNYQVILHFAEVYFGVEGRGGLASGPGSRVFNVAIEGQPKLSNFDIFTTAGGALKALEKSFNVAVTDGQLNINFTSVVNNAKVNAIEIIPFNGNTPPTLVTTLEDKTFPYDPGLSNPFSFTIPANAFDDLQDATLTYSATQENGQPLPGWINLDPITGIFTGFGSQYQVDPNFINVKVSAFDSQGLSAEDIFKITLVDPIEFNTQRINTGKATGTPYTTVGGKLFINDTYATGGTVYSANANLQIANTDDDVIYRTERWGNMTYNIPVSNGAYKVNLHFAEIYFGVTGGGGAGSRRFHVDVEGTRRLDNYDVFVKAGGAARAIQEEIYTQVTDGFLTIQFTGVTDNAKISAIEVSPFVPTLKMERNERGVLAGMQNKPIIKAIIPNIGANVLSQLTFNTNGTTNTANILKAKLYYSGLNDSFISATQIGDEVLNPSGVFNVGGFSQNLAEGNNYFWLVYDIAPNAQLGNTLGGEVLLANLSSNSVSPSIVPASANRMITQTDKTPGKMLNFDNTNDFVTLPNESLYDFSNQMTVEVWIKANPFTRNWQAIVTKGDNSWRLHRNNNTNFINFAINANTGTYGVNSTTNVNDGEWHHLAGVFTGTQLQLYVNGVKEGEVNVAANTTINNSTYPVMFGENAQATGRYFNGKMDEVRLWNVARTQNQIRESMHLVLKGLENGLIGYYQLNQTSGKAATDWIMDNDATLSAGTADANWQDATQPLGSGVVVRANATANATVNYSNAGVQITFGNTHPNNELVVTRLENVSPAVVDPAASQNKTPNYWVINNYGTKTGLSPMTIRFYVPGGFLTNDSPLAYNLFKRASNSVGNWEPAIQASAVNVAEEWVEFSGITSFSQAIIAGAGVGLPIRLISFTGERIDENKVKLNWSTALEENNAGFEVQKSENGIDFNKIGFVDGAGNSVQIKNYSYIDENAITSAYYRLKQIDYDGKFTYSPIVYINGGTTETLDIFPNPVLDEIQFKASENLLKAENVLLEIITQSGTFLSRQKGNLIALKNKLNAQIKNWTSGVYILKFQAEGKVYVIRLIKQ